MAEIFQCTVINSSTQRKKIKSRNRQWQQQISSSKSSFTPDNHESLSGIDVTGQERAVLLITSGPALYNLRTQKIYVYKQIYIYLNIYKQMVLKGKRSDD